MKSVITFILATLSITLFAQNEILYLQSDTLKIFSLVDSSRLYATYQIKELEIVGIRQSPTDPISTTRINMDIHI